MTPKMLELFAQMSASNARVAAMHAHNQAEEASGVHRFYPATAFYAESDALQVLASAAKTLAKGLTE
jgi:hypothetical protein